MQRVVRSYGTLRRTGDTLPTLIQGTAFFPGGSGLWQGERFRGPSPEFFPESPVIFVAHDFDSENAYGRSLERSGEVDSSFWKRFLRILVQAGVEPCVCFFTNALMGLNPGSAVGAMPATMEFKEECRWFLSATSMKSLHQRQSLPWGEQPRLMSVPQHQEGNGCISCTHRLGSSTLC